MTFLPKDPISLTIFAICLIFPLYAQWKVMSTYRTYSRVGASSGMTAAQAARRLLDRAGLSHVKIEPVQGYLADHYDPRSKTLRLSAPDSSALAAIGVAAHEAGHALQDAEKYPMLVLRSAVVPVAQFAPPIGIVLFMAGLFFKAFTPLLWVGILLFAAAVAFTLITLPVEFDASSRAMRILRDSGIAVGQKELGIVQKVLSAAALTYVAAAVTAVLQLISMILQAQGRRNE
jgi:Zn-dependent membrane protease YugP